MQVDDEIGIQGNGNQDTQSWYHSCEINVMVDSKQIVSDWMAAIHRQQNTELYGRLDDDGVWRDKATGRTPAQMEEWENEQARLAAEKENEGLPPKRTGSRLSITGRRTGSSSLKKSATTRRPQDMDGGMAMATPPATA